MEGITQSHKSVIFQLYGERTTLDRFLRKLAALIILSNFGFSIFMGFRSTGGRNFHFPLTLLVIVTTV